MTNNALTVERLLQRTIGFDPLCAFTAASAPTYPPHNIEKWSDDHYRLVIAVAGFRREHIGLELHRGILRVSGGITQQEIDAQPGRDYLYRGIALRPFEREFRLGDYVEVVSATMEDGLLTIDLERRLPEEKRPKQIPIR